MVLLRLGVHSSPEIILINLPLLMRIVAMGSGIARAGWITVVVGRAGVCMLISVESQLTQLNGTI